MPAVAPVDSPLLSEDAPTEALGVYVLLAEVGVDDVGDIVLVPDDKPVGVRCNAYVDGSRLVTDVMSIVAPFTALEIAFSYIRSQ
jgi:hypothetical protein